MDRPESPVWQFVKSEFDKLILLFVLCLMIASLHYFSKVHNGEGFAWAMRAYDNIEGALLTLLTVGSARVAAMRTTDKPISVVPKDEPETKAEAAHG